MFTKLVEIGRSQQVIGGDSANLCLASEQFLQPIPSSFVPVPTIKAPMKVLQPREGFLSDYEVYQHVCTATDHVRRRKGTKDQPGNLQTIQLELKNYFGNQAWHIPFQTEASITSFLDTIKDYKLTKVEKLMVLNSRPSSLAALHVLIEEHEDRFSMEEMEKLLELVRETFPIPEAEE